VHKAEHQNIVVTDDTIEYHIGIWPEIEPPRGTARRLTPCARLLAEKLQGSRYAPGDIVRSRGRVVPDYSPIPDRSVWKIDRKNE
jgi:hypothetical protein